MRLLLLLLSFSGALPGEPWARHVIDDSSRGADGVRLADVNGDGFMDIATGWEQGGVVRAYVNPGPFRARLRWPAVTVGQVASPEDAVFVDLDSDGAMDVVSSCEGRERSLYVHWAPKRPERYLEAGAWRTEPIPVARGAMRWMFALPMEVDFRRGVDLIAGAKGEGARIGWLESPANARDLAAWQWRPIYDAGWIMSLAASDMDGDGDRDILVSDRQGSNRGTLWLENPGPGEALGKPWRRHSIGDSGEEVMFLDEVDLDGDGLADVITAIKERRLVWHRRLDRSGDRWEHATVQLPERAGTAKAVRAGDIDRDGKPDLVFSCERAAGELHGVMWLSYKGSLKDSNWSAHEVSGAEGVKFDLVELMDLDSDGDLDVLTCEESANLGVIWYENPHR